MALPAIKAPKRSSHILPRGAWMASGSRTPCSFHSFLGALFCGGNSREPSGRKGRGTLKSGCISEDRLSSAWESVPVPHTSIFDLGVKLALKASFLHLHHTHPIEIAHLHTSGSHQLWASTAFQETHLRTVSRSREPRTQDKACWRGLISEHDTPGAGKKLEASPCALLSKASPGVPWSLGVACRGVFGGLSFWGFRVLSSTLTSSMEKGLRFSFCGMRGFPGGRSGCLQTGSRPGSSGRRRASHGTSVDAPCQEEQRVVKSPFKAA